MLAQGLKIGDTIGFVAPSKPILEQHKIQLDTTIQRFQELGFKTRCAKNCFAVDKYNISAGEPRQRADDLNEMFVDPEVKMIHCVIGGDTANQILSLIDYENIKKNPKIFLGMSDADVLHLAIHQKTGLVVFNGADARIGGEFGLGEAYTWDQFQQRLIHKSKIIPASSERTCVRKGIAEGKILGCNLDSIIKLAGTPYFPDFTDGILFLEGYRDTVLKLVFKLQQLKDIGIFHQIKGIVIGYIFGFQDETAAKESTIEANYEDIVLDLTKEFNFPILKTNDFGHKCPTCCLPIGARVRVDATNKTIEIIEDFLE